MTIYAYQNVSSQILAVWPVGVGHRAEVVADATGLPTGFVQRVCFQLGCLSEREAGVVRLRFGLTDGRPRTLDEIGQVYGVARERIRQIEPKTMSKLRHPSRSQGLRDYLE